GRARVRELSWAASARHARVVPARPGRALLTSRLRTWPHSIERDQALGVGVGHPLGVVSIRDYGLPFAVAQHENGDGLVVAALCACDILECDFPVVGHGAADRIGLVHGASLAAPPT